jgi:hypothetical protein
LGKGKLKSVLYRWHVSTPRKSKPKLNDTIEEFSKEAG